MFCGTDILNPVDSYFACKKIGSLYHLWMVHDTSVDVGTLTLSVSQTQKSKMKLVTRFGGDVELLENLVQVYASIERPSGNILDTDEDGWDGVGRFR